MIGLFAQLSGTIRNLTLDASCAFTSTATSGINHYTGSFVGKLLNSSTIDNCTNKATVTALVSGGGIAGAKLDKETVTISNCRNYGTVVFRPNTPPRRTSIWAASSARPKPKPPSATVRTSES